jgi:hypothetical protein
MAARFRIPSTPRSAVTACAGPDAKLSCAYLRAERATRAPSSSDLPSFASATTPVAPLRLLGDRPVLSPSADGFLRILASSNNPESFHLARELLAGGRP